MKNLGPLSDDAAEIDPGGNMSLSKKNLREGWDAFMKMVDKPRKFKYDNMQVRMLTNAVTLAVGDSEADIKIQGQQMGGKTKGSVVLRKIHGTWKIEFDQITPILSMPALDAAGKNQLNYAHLFRLGKINNQKIGVTSLIFLNQHELCAGTAFTCAVLRPPLAKDTFCKKLNDSSSLSNRSAMGLGPMRQMSGR